MLYFYTYKRKKSLGSYPILQVVFSITLALFMTGLLGLLALHTETLTTFIRENLEIQVYLTKNISENESIRIHQLLSKKPFILKKNKKAQINFIPKEVAAKKKW